MASKLHVGDFVFVPRSKVGITQENSAFYHTSVQAVNGKKILINLPYGKTTEIASSLVHRDVGVLIARIGDFDTEYGLLNPLAKSLLQYLRLLLPDDQVRTTSMRSVCELQTIAAKFGASFPYVVFVGHGSKNGISFGVDGTVGPERLGKVFVDSNWMTKGILSLCCQTGYADFGQKLSKYPCTSTVIAPFHSVHGALASQFSQIFFTNHLLEGYSKTVAFTRARKAVVGSASFRLWQDGKLKAGS